MSIIKSLLASIVVVAFVSMPAIAKPKMELPEACKADCEGMHAKKCAKKAGISEDCKAALDHHKDHGKHMKKAAEKPMEEGAQKAEESATEIK